MDRKQTKQLNDGIAAATRWNETHPEGTAVKYFPIAGEAEFVLSKTRSEAWVLGHGEPVAKIEGLAGGVCLSHLEVQP